MELTKHFTHAEAECRCGCNKEIGYYKNIIRTAMLLEVIRKAVGAPIRVNSWYRCKKHNKAVGGVVNSHHLTGRAVDITVQGYSPRALERIINQTFNYGGRSVFWVKSYDNFVHVDTRYMIPV